MYTREAEFFKLIIEKGLNIIKKITSVILALCMLISVWSMPVSATTPEKSTAARYASQITEDELHINEDVARYIAEFFIRDMADNGFATWDREAEIIDIVPMYDETGENINAYTAELSQGYVVVSAYVDMPSIILEWSDEAEPVYKDFSSEEGKIVYTGTLAYYLDSGSETLQAIDGTEVPKEYVDNKDIELRSIDNVPVEALENIVDAHNSPSIETHAYGDQNDEDGYISDVFIYASNVYGATWKNNGYQNNWESAANYAVTSSFPNYKRCCGPVAITNAIKMYGNKYNRALIKSSSNSTVFSRVIKANTRACLKIEGMPDFWPEEVRFKEKTASQPRG